MNLLYANNSLGSCNVFVELGEVADHFICPEVGFDSGSAGST